MKVQTYVETCQPGESPRLGVAEAPPFGKGGFGQATDTGWVREVTSTDQLGAKLAAGTARRAKLAAGTGRRGNR